MARACRRRPGPVAASPLPARPAICISSPGATIPALRTERGTAFVSAAVLAGFSLVVVALLGLGAASTMLRRRIVAPGCLGLCAAGFLLALAGLLAGGGAATLTVPLGLPGRPVTLALDGLSGFFLLLVMAAGAAASAAALDGKGADGATAACFPAFLGAMALTLLAGDSFALLLGLELMSLSACGLILTRHDDAEARAAALRQLGVAAFGAVCLIAALAVLAANAAWDVRFAAMRAAPPEGWPAAFVLVLALLGAGAKAGLMPLHAWLPRGLVAAPAHVSALMAGGMTKVALYVLVRVVFDLCGPAQPGWWGGPLLVLGATAAVLGALRANREDDIKAVLAGATLGSVGLIVTGLGLALAARGADLSTLAALGLGGAMLAALAHALSGSLLFLAAGAVQQGAGSRSLLRLGGLIHRMPVTTACVLVGAASLAALPPSAGFAAQWTLFQAVLGGPRIGGPGVQVLVCAVAGLLALATALAAAAAVRLVGIAFLGRPRSPRASAADDAGRHTRQALIGLAAASGLVGLFPGAVLWLAGPALRRLVSADMADRAGLLAVAPQTDLSGYSAPGIALVLALAGGLAVWLVRARTVPGQREAPAWDGGFGPPPAWLPFGDPLTQYGGASFAQPLLRALGVRAWPAWPALRPVARVSALAERFWGLSARTLLAVMFAVLVGFLVAVVVTEQS